MDNCVLRIEKLANGYEVEIADPEVKKNNANPKKPYKDPWVGYALLSVEDVKEFIGKHLDSLEPPADADDEYGAEFVRQTEEE
jgi:hypothetical protein